MRFQRFWPYKRRYAVLSLGLKAYGIVDVMKNQNGIQTALKKVTQQLIVICANQKMLIYRSYDNLSYSTNVILT